MEQVSARSDALIVLKDAFLRNAIETVDRRSDLRETVLVSKAAVAADPALAGSGLGPSHNDRPA